MVGKPANGEPLIPISSLLADCSSRAVEGTCLFLIETVPIRCKPQPTDSEKVLQIR
jgi:hypothetical protein